jgi:hypothetical protein
MYEIHADIPVPPLGKMGGRARHYPLDRMAPGDSIFVPIKKGEDIHEVASRAYSAVQSYRKKNKAAKFAVRRQVTRVGIWRVA